jgi:molybdopterin-containing oxidoreductase family membrane subunit
VGFGIGFALLMVLLTSVGLLFLKGLGIWGLNNPVGWAFAIINFVWWIGIGHAGTLISAILLLLRQEWRTSINRFAEAMTLFAVACAGLFPILHVGRPWLAYWLFPYPNSMAMWPNFRSPLLWDVFAVSTYATISLLFWFVGLIPDLATLRDRTESKIGRMVYGVLALGWRNSARHWHRYETAYLLLAGLSTPLVLSVHTIVSFDFAVAVIPGWHATIFPPYFVAGAIYAGFAMVLTLAIPLRWAYGLEDFVTMRHLNNMGRVMLATGLVVAYGYMMEAFFAWYSANTFEVFMMRNRMTGPYGAVYWALILFNVLIPQALWFQRVRSNIPALFMIAMSVNVGMWLERFVIVVTSLHRDFLPSSWGMYYPTVWDWATYVGTIGLFLSLLFLFIRFLPMISIFEMRTLVPEANVHGKGHGKEESA